MAKKFALIELTDDVAECKVTGFMTKEDAVKELKQVLLKMVEPSNKELNLCESIKKAVTYAELEKICQDFRWGENDVRILFIEEIK